MGSTNLPRLAPGDGDQVIMTALENLNGTFNVDIEWYILDTHRGIVYIIYKYVYKCVIQNFTTGIYWVPFVEQCSFMLFCQRLQILVVGCCAYKCAQKINVNNLNNSKCYHSHFEMRFARDMIRCTTLFLPPSSYKVTTIACNSATRALFCSVAVVCRSGDSIFWLWNV